MSRALKEREEVDSVGGSMKALVNKKKIRVRDEPVSSPSRPLLSQNVLSRRRIERRILKDHEIRLLLTVSQRNFG